MKQAIYFLFLMIISISSFAADHAERSHSSFDALSILTAQVGCQIPAAHDEKSKHSPVPKCSQKGQ